MTRTACRDVRPLLSAYLDADLDAAQIREVRQHLDDCSACAGIAADLGRVTAAAGSLGPLAPPDSVRAAVTTAIGQATRQPTRPHWSAGALAQWAGLSAALLAITTVAYVFRTPAPDVGADRAPAPQDQASVAVNREPVASDAVTAAVAQYDREIAALEAAVGAGSGQLESAAAAALSGGGEVVDLAIAESRAAVRASPDSEPAQLSLFEALRRKIAMLQATVTLINEMNQGDSAGAAAAAEGLGRES